ncbi:hypothetical protein Pfo_002761 [Paulownia fortunei]|nr:hypothetical protein Pfo_002761 [Paulownia fortunei]
MKSIFILAGLFCVALFASTTNARKDLGEYWQGDMKDQPKPELIIQGLVDVSKVTSIFKKRSDYRSSTEPLNFDPKPSISTDDEKSLAKDFEPRPGTSAGTNDDKAKEEKIFTNEFKTSTNLWVYNDDPQPEEKSFRKEFNTGPNLWVYSDDAKPRDENLFTKEFKTEPGFRVYNDNV